MGESWRLKNHETTDARQMTGEKMKEARRVIEEEEKIWRTGEGMGRREEEETVQSDNEAGINSDANQLPVACWARSSL